MKSSSPLDHPTQDNYSSSQSLAFADRLKPLCAQQQQHEQSSLMPIQMSSAERCPRRKSSPQQEKAKGIVKKYKKRLQRIEFRRLRAVVPAVADNIKASQSDILEESIRYIDELHQKLLERIHTKGLPSMLLQLQDAQQQQSNTLSSLTDLKDLVGNALRPQLERTLRRKRAEDNYRLERVLQITQQQKTEY